MADPRVQWKVFATGGRGLDGSHPRSFCTPNAETDGRLSVVPGFTFPDQELGG
jgi:hypothetical protein